MAQVSFTISAIDKTRAAFASINQGMRNLVRGGDQTEKKFFSMGLKAVGLGSVLAVVGSQVRKVAEDIRSVPGVSDDVIRSWDQMKARAAEAGGVMQNMAANAGHALNSLGGLIRFGALAMNPKVGVGGAQADLLANERALAEAAKINSGWYDKLAEATQRLMKARLDLKHVSESDGASISRRRGEADMLDKRAAGMADQIKQATTQAQAAELRTAAERDYQKLLKEEKELTTDLALANGKLLGSTMPLTERIEGLEAAWANLNHELFAHSEISDPKVLEKRNELLKQQKVIVNELTKAHEEQERRAAEAARVVTSSFEDAVFAGASLREMIRGIGQDLMRYIFQQTVTKSLGNLIVGGITSIFGGGAAAGSAAGNIHVASGGPVTAGQTYTVGEQGRELFTPNQSGFITPNHALGGGGGNTYVIDARGTDESVVQRLTAALFQLAGPGVVERRAIGAVGDFRARGARA